MSSYPYQQLDVSRREIRLLILDPASQRSNELSGSLIHASLREKSSYEALSYRWGQPPFQDRIQIDGCVFEIGPNLAVALRELRKSDACRTLWIDAICINQNDEEERRQQVGEMQDIFTAAAQVLAWVGEAGEHGELAMSLLEHLQEKDLTDFRATKFKSPDWIALKDFWARSYWKRIWVVQELALASERALIGCGSQWIPRSDFDNALEILLLHRNNHDTLLWEAIDSEMDWFLNLSLICRSVSQSTKDYKVHDLEYLLYLTEHFEATEPHDHFFALLGLSQQADRLAIPVDYTTCFADICAKVVFHIIKRTESLNVLSGNRSKQDENRSSWMPSFSDPVRRGYGWNTFRKFQAAGPSKAAVNLSPCQRLLSCEGIEIGNVSSIEGPFQNEKSAFVNARTILNMRRIAVDAFLAARSRYEFDLAFWETLFANRSVEHGFEDSLNLTTDQFESLTILLDHEESETEAGLRKIEDALQDCISPYICNFVSTLRFRCFFVTSNGYIGVGPYNIECGDLAVILSGADVPFILREEGDGFRLIGDAFIYGIMHGELLQQTATRRIFRLK